MWVVICKTGQLKTCVPYLDKIIVLIIRNIVKLQQNVQKKGKQSNFRYSRRVDSCIC